MQKIIGSLLAVCLSFGCSHLYYSFWETFGVEKKDLLRDEVKSLKNDQESVHKELDDALTRLRALYSVPPSELSDAYDNLRDAYKDAQSQKVAFDERVKKVQDISSDLFTEWEGELSKLKTARYRQDSQQKLRATKQRYEKLEASMLKAQKDLKPVLSALEEQVIYVKHNLNAQALGGLKAEMKTLESDMNTLRGSIQKSMSESQSFLDKLAGE